MKKLSFALLIACSSLLAYTPDALAAQRKRVAVLAFQNLTANPNTDWVGTGIAELITSKLTQSQAVDMIERLQIDKMIKEIAFSQTGFVDQKNAVKVGKLVSANTLVIGSYQLIGDLSAPKSQIMINARFVDTETGQVISTADVRGNGEDLFSLEDEVALKLIASLDIQETSEIRTAVKVNPTTSLAALKDFSRAWLLFFNGDTAQAFTLTQEALKADPNYKDALKMAAHISARYGRYDQALEYYLKLLSIQQKPIAQTTITKGKGVAVMPPSMPIPSDRIGAGRTLGNIASLYSNKGQYHQALSYYSQSLAVSREIGDRASEGFNLGSIGRVYYRMGQYDQALSYYNQSLPISQEVGDIVTQSNTLASLGEWYGNKRQFDQALEYHNQSLSIRREIGDRAGEGHSLVDIGSIQTLTGQFDLALKSYNQSLSISQEIGDRAGQARTFGSIGSLYGNMRQFEQSISYFSQALAIHREIGDRAGEGVSLGNIGLAYSAKQDYEKAHDYFTEALEVFQNVGDRVGEHLALHSLSLIHEIWNEPEEALAYLEQCVVIDRELGLPHLERDLMRLRRLKNLK